MLRRIDRHHTNAMNLTLEVRADERDAKYGNASHYYEIEIDDRAIRENASVFRMARLEFQRGPIKEVGVNGISNEALIAVLIDRLEGFQSGPFASRENALALTKLEEAMHWLQERTRKRVARGVEGTNEV